MTVDHNMALRDEATAKADSVLKKYYTLPSGNNPGGWDPSKCNHNTLIWDPADDTTDGQGHITHNPIDNQFRITITLAAQDASLVNHKNCELAIDQVTGQVYRTSFTRPQQTSLRMQPVFAGSQYPFLSGSGGLVP